MKKIILTAAAASLLSTSAFATENMFFVKADGGYSNFTNPKVEGSKVKGGSTGFLGVGVGYYLMENVRFDLTYNHFFSPKHTLTAPGHSDALATLVRAEGAKPVVAEATTKTAVAGIISGATDDQKKKQSLKHKITTNVNTLMVNGMVDVYEMDGFKASVGAGVGIAKVSSKIKFHANQFTALGKELATVKAKSKTNFAFAAHVAGAYAVSEGVDLELSYSYRHFGKTNAFKLGKATISKAKKMSSHNIGLGVRFEI